jgi:hypothetical protein
VARSRHAVGLVAGLAVFVSTVNAAEPAAASPPSTGRGASAAQAPDEAEPLEIDRSQERFAEVAEQAEGASDGAVELPPGALDGQLSGTLAEQVLGAGEPPTPAELDPADADPTDLTLVEDLDADGEVTPPPPPQPEPQVDVPTVPEPPADADPPEVGELAELAQDVDLGEVEPGEEITELRTEESRTFLDEDGKLRTEISTTPLHVEDDQGDMVEIDPSLEGAADQRWRPEATEAEVSFGATADTGALGAIGFGPGRQVSWSLDGADDVPGTAAGDTVRYDDVFEGVDIELQATATGVKETLVLADASAPAVYDFPLSVTGLDPVLDDPFGAVRFADPDTGETAGLIPAAWAVDSSEGPRGERPDPVSVAYGLVGGGADPVLRLTVDEAWLRDPARVFPVIVDPTVTLGNYVPSGDTYVDSSAAGSNFSTLPYLKMAGDSGHRRTYYAVWNLGLLSSTAIIGASYKALNYYSHSCSPAYFGVFRVTTPWNPATVTWNSRPTYASTPIAAQNVAHGFNSSCPDAWIDSDVTNLVQGWVDGVHPNYGIAVGAGEGYDETASEGTGAEGNVFRPVTAQRLVDTRGRLRHRRAPTLPGHVHHRLFDMAAPARPGLARLAQVALPPTVGVVDQHPARARALEWSSGRGASRRRGGTSPRLGRRPSHVPVASIVATRWPASS